MGTSSPYHSQIRRDSFEEKENEEKFEKKKKLNIIGMMKKISVFLVVFAFTAISCSNGLKCWGPDSKESKLCTFDKQGPSKDELNKKCEKKKDCNVCQRTWLSVGGLAKSLALTCADGGKTGCEEKSGLGAKGIYCGCKKDLCNAATKNDFGFILVVGLLLVGGLY